MSFVLAFDLDDTLYDERSYVESGFRAVAEEAERRYGWPQETSFRFLCAVLDDKGRGAIFDRWLEAHDRLSKAEVKRCVSLYRAHRPDIRLAKAAQSLLPELARRYPLYLVTDGNKLVQRRKIAALGITPFFRQSFVTHQYGIAQAKPSPHCFERILAKENCGWADLVYVGDNPAKDFIALNQRGGHSVRVLTGGHRNAVARPGYEAAVSIASLDELPAVLERL